MSLNGSNFEIDIDANLKVDHSPSIDWASPTVIGVKGEDEPTGQSDDSFGQGSKEDTAVPAVVDGSIPNNKSDLLNFGFYLETVNPSTQFLHLYWQRVQEPSGTTNMDFEFNKNKAEGTGLSSNGVTPKRSAGDLLLQYDLAQGGTNPQLFLSTWVTTGSSSQCEAANSVPCWSDRVNLTTSGIATGSINTSAIPVGDSDGLGAMSPRTFGEASVDWDRIAGGTGCTSFGSAYLKSRSSDSFTAAMKDFIAPESTGFDSCGSMTWVKRDSTVSGTAGLLGGATFSVCRTHSYPPLTLLDPAPACVSVTDRTATSLTGPDTDADAGEFRLDNLALGRYTITETAAPTGYDIVTGTQTIDITSAIVFSASIPFVNNPKMKVIVLTCNTVTEKLVDSTVELDIDKDATTDNRKETLTGSTFDSLCATGGAVYDNLAWDTYSGTVEVPDQPTLFTPGQ